MENVKALLIIHKYNFWQHLKYHFNANVDLYDRDHYLIVPNSFIIGTFKKRKQGFVLSSRGAPCYQTSPEKLKEIQEELDKGKFSIVKEVSLSESELEVLANQGKTMVDAKKQYENNLAAFTKYFA